MDNLMIMLSAAIPTEDILEKLQESITVYNIDPTEEHLKSIEAICALFLTNMRTKGSVQGAMEMIEEFKRFEQREKLFNIDKN